MPAMNGALIIDKAADMTSHDVVARVRKLIGERRVGHTGTLDPFATGVLVVLVGKATRLAQFLSGADKEYEAVIRFGFATETGDITGAPIKDSEMREAASLHPAEIEAAMASLRGEIEQIPPMYSAKKIQGQKLYELARRGEQIQRRPARVTIYEFQSIAGNDGLLKMNDDGSIDLSARVTCSAGTYVRVLAEDLGRRLGVGAHLAELRRIRSGRFNLDAALTLDRLAQACEDGSINELMISPYEALAHLPAIELDQTQAQDMTHGIDLIIDSGESDGWQDDESIRLSYQQELIAVGKFDRERGIVHPSVVLTTA